MSVVCIDCRKEGVTNVRVPALYRGKPVAGSRCVTHHRAKKKATKDRSWETRLWKVYHITAEQYWAIYEAQGRVCAICRRATGEARKLAVDHDHACCGGPESCGRCVRSLCCTSCNKLLGHIRDDLEIAERIVHYLMRPPGREVLAEWPSAQ